MLPWSTYPSDLSQGRSVSKGSFLEEAGLSPNLDEPSTLPVLVLVVFVCWITYRKQERPGHLFSLTLSLWGAIALGIVWYLFVFIEQKTSLISANEAYISTLIQPSIGYFLSIIGCVLLFMSGFLKNPQQASSPAGIEKDHTID
jgi:hypothetical protein